MDSLRRRVLERDKAHNSPRAMRATSRPVEARLICFDCRQTPDRAHYRERWLAANPLPKRDCSHQYEVGNVFDSPAAHKRWHEAVHVRANMPPFTSLTGCQFCGGRMIEVVG